MGLRLPHAVRGFTARLFSKAPPVGYRATAGPATR